MVYDFNRRLDDHVSDCIKIDMGYMDFYLISKEDYPLIINKYDYIESLNYFSFNRHNIGIASTDKFVYQKLKENFVKALVDNAYLDELKNVEILNYNSEKEIIDSQKREIDSLAVEYLKIRKNESYALQYVPTSSISG